MADIIYLDRAEPDWDKLARLLRRASRYWSTMFDKGSDSSFVGLVFADLLSTIIEEGDECKNDEEFARRLGTLLDYYEVVQRASTSSTP